MALPTPEKSWIFKTVIIPFTTSAAVMNQYFWYNLKQMMTVNTGWNDETGASVTNAHPWTVSASSNGTVANTSDNWSSFSSVVFLAAGAHSWIVLRQAAINPTYEICFSQGATNPNSNSYVSHQAGFTLSGLVTTADPTATDRITFLINQPPIFAAISAGIYLVVAMSTDGQCTRIFAYMLNQLYVFWLFDKPRNPVSGWTNPSIALMHYNSGNVVPSAYTELTDNALISGLAPGGIPMTLYTTTEFYSSAAIGEGLNLPNQLTGEWQFFPTGLFSNTSGVCGRHGEIFDLWFVADRMFSGTKFSGTHSFMCLPYLTHVWDNTLINTSP